MISGPEMNIFGELFYKCISAYMHTPVVPKKPANYLGPTDRIIIILSTHNAIIHSRTILWSSELRLAMTMNL